MARRKSAALAGAAAAALLAFPGVASAAVTSEVDAGVLTVESDAGDAITITCVGNQVQVNGGNPDTGAAACDAITSIVVNGDDGANVIDLSGVADKDDNVDTDFPAIASVTIDGRGGNDTITGSEHTDTMRGGDGADRIVGDENKAPGSFDVFEGQAGDDTLVWNPGHDSDKMDGGDGADTIEVNGGGGGEQFTVKPSATAGRVQFDRTGPTPPGPFTLDIGTAERLDLNANGGDDDDLNEGGDGIDTIEVNGAALPEQFTVKPSPKAGRILFDRLTTPPGPFNIDIGTAERLDLNMNGGDDTLTADPGFDPNFKLDVEGSDGNDSIDGGDAADLLSGGNGDDRITGDDNPDGTADESRGDAGNDTMIWNPGDDTDLNEGGDGIDTAEVNGGSGDERFTVNPSAVAGRVSFNRTDPAPFAVDIGTTENLVLNAAAGNDRIKGAAGLAALIKSTLNGDDGNDRVTGTDGEDRLSGGKGIDIMNSRDKAEDIVDCAGGLDLAFVDKRDFLRGCEIVLGGALRVKAVGKVADVAGGSALVKMRCVATKGCKGKARLRRGGKTLAAGKFRMDRGKTKDVRLKLTRRGRRQLEDGLRARLVIDATDANGNGWRTTARVRVAD
jgi:Ca2+-binding RTX toxin-like protein